MTRIVRAFLEEVPEGEGQELLLSEEEARHLSRVLRVQIGDQVELLDGIGGVYSSECVEVDRSRVLVRLLKARRCPAGFQKIQMAVAMSKGKKWEELIRPMIELGAHRLTPVITERSEGTWPKKKQQEKANRWLKLAREGCKQSGNSWLPMLDEPIAFTKLLSKSVESERWLASLNAEAGFFSVSPKTDSIILFIGPEGGWSKREEEAAMQAGVSFFSLGPHALRMETAAVAALAVARQSLLC